MGRPEGDTKEGALRAIVEVLEATATPYAVIGGVAMQIVHSGASNHVGCRPGGDAV